MSGYIGTQPVPQATQTRDSFTATSGQTTFATSGYTPNFLDVYLNGVKLASADYTATNGSDVVLASGAATGDILEVVAFTTFNSASSSIDDNGNATAITIDGNENILAGKTSSSFNTAGFELFGNADKGKFWATRDGGIAAAFNRKNSDGDIALFAKDGSTVGSIGSSNTGERLYMANDSTGLSFIGDFSNIFPCDSGGAPRDNAINLGGVGGRFKNLYLSGGVYLGGTGSANYLDDYEEGTWTATADTGTVTAAHTNYVKVGRLVTVAGNIGNFSNRTSGNGVAISGLPFTSSSASRTTGAVMIRNTNNTAITAAYITASGTAVEFYGVTSGAFDILQHNELNSSSAELYFTISYYTDA